MDFHLSNNVRDVLLYVLWHHQGGSSAVGQPIRAMLGIGPNDRMTGAEVEAANGVEKRLKAYKIPSTIDPEEAENVHVLPVVTTHDIPAERILRAALKAGMSKVVILGYDADDEEYFASSVADGGTVLWLMERCKKKLIDID